MDCKRMLELVSGPSQAQDVTVHPFRPTNRLKVVKHPVFLSHSGAQKDFTEQLCKDLEQEHLFPFFDKHHESLPKGERFPPLIFDAAERCSVVVLVLSDDYFSRSKWPMLELVACMEARESANRDLKILPLFFKLSPKEMKDRSNQHVWFEKWEVWASEDDTIDIGKWQHALSSLGAENGLNFRSYPGEVAYREAAVATIQRLIPNILKFDDSYVQGRERVCQVVKEAFEENTSINGGVQMLGMHGIGGIGKTTFCKAMCNQFHASYRGKVCHVEFRENTTILDLQKKILRELTHANEGLLCFDDLDQGRALLKERINGMSIFVALDNVSHSSKVKVEAQLLLDALEFSSPTSKVLVCARSLDVLQWLSGNETWKCIPCPRLNKVEAAGLLLLYATPRLQLSSFNSDCQRVVYRCVERCFNGHPLTLRTLGCHLRSISNCDPIKWVWKLDDLDVKIMHDPDNLIFPILRIGYDALPSDRERLVFMDVALFATAYELGCIKRLCRWLVGLHRRKHTEILELLIDMRSRSLIEDWRVTEDNLSKVRVHELFKEFAQLEIKKGDLKNWCLYEDANKSSNYGQAITNVDARFLRVKILGSDVSLKAMEEWLDINLEILHLQNCNSIQTLDLRKVEHLHTLNLLKCESLRDIQVSPSFGWLEIFKFATKTFGQMSPIVTGHGNWNFLQYLRIEDCNDLITPLDLRSSSHLTEFRLMKCKKMIQPPDLRGCKALEFLELHSCDGLTSPPDLKSCIGLRKLMVWGCSRMARLPLLTGCSNLETLEIGDCPELRETPILDNCTSLQTLGFIGEFKYEIKFPRLSKLSSLRNLHIGLWNTADSVLDIMSPDIERLEMFNSQSLRYSSNVFSLSKLNYLGVSGCSDIEHLLGFMSAFPLNLRVLNIYGSQIDLSIFGAWQVTPRSELELRIASNQLSQQPSLPRSFTSTIKKLHVVCTRELGKILDLHGFEGSTLESLVIMGNHNIQEVHGLEMMSALVELRLENLMSLSYISDMSGLCHLKSVKFNNRGVLNDGQLLLPHGCEVFSYRNENPFGHIACVIFFYLECPFWHCPVRETHYTKSIQPKVRSYGRLVDGP